MFKNLFGFVSFLFLVGCNVSKEKADRIYFNAKVWTGDSSLPFAESIAITADRIIYVGKNYEHLQSDSTTMIDLEGKLVVPGFIDNHTHFLTGGHDLASVDLRPAKTKAEFIQIMKDYCATNPGNTWVVGGNWDHEAWGGELPTHDWIDSVTGDHPVFVSRYDGHMALANLKAIQFAGITKSTVTPKGGEIVRRSSGEPSGVMKDESMGLVFSKIPNPSQNELDDILERAIQHALQNGVTQVHDMGSYGGWLDLETYRRAYQNKKLAMRIYSFVPLSTWKTLDSFCQKNGKGDDVLRWGGLKGFVDGSLGSTTAWFYQPFLDAPSTSGFPVTDTNDLREWVLGADKANLHVAVHAIGERANDFILRVYDEVAKSNSNINQRFRIEHAQHLSNEAIKKFSSLNVIASMQPYHAIDDGRWAYKRLDDDRLKRTYAFKSLIDSKATLTFGSDWAVAPLNPLEGIYAAVTRRTLDDKNLEGWYPEQKISVEQALKSYTINNAYSGYQENKLGVLKKGMLADFVILDHDLFAVPPEEIRHIKVSRTIVDGKEVFIRQATLKSH